MEEQLYANLIKELDRLRDESNTRAGNDGKDPKIFRPGNPITAQEFELVFEALLFTIIKGHDHTGNDGQFKGELISGQAIKEKAIAKKHIATPAIDHEHLNTDAVRAEAIKDQEVKTAKIADKAVDSSKIKQGAVGFDELAPEVIFQLNRPQGGPSTYGVMRFLQPDIPKPPSSGGGIYDWDRDWRDIDEKPPKVRDDPWVDPIEPDMDPPRPTVDFDIIKPVAGGIRIAKFKEHADDVVKENVVPKDEAMTLSHYGSFLKEAFVGGAPAADGKSEVNFSKESLKRTAKYVESLEKEVISAGMVGEEVLARKLSAALAMTSEGKTTVYHHGFGDNKVFDHNGDGKKFVTGTLSEDSLGVAKRILFAYGFPTETLEGLTVDTAINEGLIDILNTPVLWGYVTSGDVNIKSVTRRMSSEFDAICRISFTVPYTDLAYCVSITPHVKKEGSTFKVPKAALVHRALDSVDIVLDPIDSDFSISIFGELDRDEGQ